MSNLILIRHSLPEINPALPANQWSLSQEGRDRCKLLADKVAGYSPDVIVASVEPKAGETARILARHLNLNYDTVEGLHEHDRGDLEWIGREGFEVRVAELFQHPGKLVMGRETAHQAHERFTRTVVSLTVCHPGRDIAVVAHGTVMALFVARALGLEPFAFWKSLGLPSFVALSLPRLELITLVENLEDGNDR